MPLPFDHFQGTGVFGFSSSLQDKFCAFPEKIGVDFCYSTGNNGSFPEPTSMRSPSPLASSTTTLSSSHGGASAAVSGGDHKCSQMGLEDLDGVLSDSPAQEQSILRLIMGVAGDPGSGFGCFNPSFGFESGSFPFIDNPNLLLLGDLPLQEQPVQPYQQKLQISVPEVLLNQSQYIVSTATNPPACSPAKRINLGQNGSRPNLPPNQTIFPSPDPGHDPFLTFRQLPPPPTMAEDGQLAVVEQLFNTAELIASSGDGDNVIIAQEILARLNHHLNTNTMSISNNKPPFQRAALYVTEALQALVFSKPAISSQNLIQRIAAYRDFLELSPFLQFVNFTTNQTIIESLEGFDRIHIIDFDVGYGNQWASLMQELVGRNIASPPLKITAFVSPSTVSDELELRFTQENLRSFAGEVNIPFEIELLSFDLLLNPVLFPVSLRSSEREAIAVNLPVSSVNPRHLPLILRFLEQVSPNVVVCLDRVCERNDTPFPNGVIHALQYCTSLLESLDAANPSADVAESIERFWLLPWTQSMLANRHRWTESLPAWRSVFDQCGFSPACVSRASEAQAECLVQRSSVRGFHVEKRHYMSSLCLCWRRKELVTVSAWKHLR